MAVGDDITEWFAPGLDVTLEYPTEENSRYRATVEEFGLSAEGNTLDDAYQAVVRHVVSMVVGLALRGESLPDRTAWLEHHGTASDGGDG